MVATTFILVRYDSLVYNRIAAFFMWAFKQGGPDAMKLAYVPMPASVYQGFAFLQSKAPVKQGK